jgi:hypothetical protein
MHLNDFIFLRNRIVLLLHHNNNKNFKIMTTLNEILESKEFNEMFDFEQEQKDLENDGWTLEEVRKFAKYLIKNQ